MKVKLGQIGRYARFLAELARYRRMPGAEAFSFRDLYPCLDDKTATTSFDSHYFYQDIWALGKIRASAVAEHVDVGSKIDFVGFLTVFTKVTFIDIRPLVAELDNLVVQPGSILSLPFGDDTVFSLSCLHVAEHIGLGRYGDPLDPLGTAKACRELARVLSPGGNLYFGVPVGRSRLCFNAHRILSPRQVLDYFDGLRLVEFSFVDDAAHFLRNADPVDAAAARYGCGLFHFTK